jgi:hypothetical protein
MPKGIYPLSVEAKAKRSLVMTLTNILYNPCKKGMFSGKKHPGWKGGISRGYGRSLLKKESCIFCGSKINLLEHHIDGNPKNNVLDNLECWCKRCHQKHHKIGFWKKTRNPNNKIVCCKVCNKEFMQQTCKRKFCSKKCYLVWVKK